MRNTIISVVVMFAFFAFYQLYYFINPFRKRVDQYYNSFFYYKDLKRSVKGLVLLILLISGVSTVYMWSKLFHKISSLNMKDAGEYVYAFFPDQFIFAFPAFFMGILTTTIIIDFFSRVFLKKYYWEIIELLRTYGSSSHQKISNIQSALYCIFVIVSIIYLAFFTN